MHTNLKTALAVAGGITIFGLSVGFGGDAVHPSDPPTAPKSAVVSGGAHGAHASPVGCVAGDTC
jgi:hypothetical protein